MKVPLDLPFDKQLAWFYIEPEPRKYLIRNIANNNDVNYDNAEFYMMEAMVKLLDRHDEVPYVITESVESIVIKTAHNIFLNAMDKRNRRKGKLEILPVEAKEDFSRSKVQYKRDEQQKFDREKIRIIKENKHKISNNSDHVDVFLKYTIEGFTYPELKIETGLSLENLRAIIFKCRKRVNDIFGDLRSDIL